MFRTFTAFLFALALTIGVAAQSLQSTGVSGTVPRVAGTYAGSDDETFAATTSATITNTPIGTASGGRIVYMGVAVRNSTGNPNILTVSFGGSAATILFNSNLGTGNISYAIAALAMPTGTTTSVAVTTSSNMTSISVGVYAVNNLRMPFNPIVVNGMNGTATYNTGTFATEADALEIYWLRSDNVSWTASLSTTTSYLCPTATANTCSTAAQNSTSPTATGISGTTGGSMRVMYMSVR